MTREEFAKINQETFDELPAYVKADAVAYNNEYVLQYHVECQRCHHRAFGTLAELRGKPCEECGYGDPRRYTSQRSA